MVSHRQISLVTGVVELIFLVHTGSLFFKIEEHLKDRGYFEGAAINEFKVAQPEIFGQCESTFRSINQINLSGNLTELFDQNIVTTNNNINKTPKISQIEDFMSIDNVYDTSYFNVINDHLNRYYKSLREMIGLFGNVFFIVTAIVLDQQGFWAARGLCHVCVFIGIVGILISNIYFSASSVILPFIGYTCFFVGNQGLIFTYILSSPLSPKFIASFRSMVEVSTGFEYFIYTVYQYFSKLPNNIDPKNGLFQGLMVTIFDDNIFWWIVLLYQPLMWFRTVMFLPNRHFEDLSLIIDETNNDKCILGPVEKHDPNLVYKRMNSPTQGYRLGWETRFDDQNKLMIPRRKYAPLRETVVHFFKYLRRAITKANVLVLVWSINEFWLGGGLFSRRKNAYCQVHALDQAERLIKLHNIPSTSAAETIKSLAQNDTKILEMCNSDPEFIKFLNDSETNTTYYFKYITIVMALVFAILFDQIIVRHVFWRKSTAGDDSESFTRKSFTWKKAQLYAVISFMFGITFCNMICHFLMANVEFYYDERQNDSFAIDMVLKLSGDRNETEGVIGSSQYSVQ